MTTIARGLRGGKGLLGGSTSDCDRPVCVVARLLAVLLLFFGIADALTTEATLLIGGAYEANPIVATMRDTVGALWIMPKMIGHGLLAWLTVRFATPSMLAVMALLTLTLTAVTSNNFALLGDAVGLYTLETLRAAL